MFLLKNTTTTIIVEDHRKSLSADFQNLYKELRDQSFPVCMMLARDHLSIQWNLRHLTP